MSQKTRSSVFFRAAAISTLLVFVSAFFRHEISAATTEVIPARFFGHHGMGFGSNGIPTPAKPYGLFRIWDHWGCGNVGWSGIEPSKGTFSWRAMDAVVDSLKTKNVDILYCFGKSTPSWAASTETDITTTGASQRIGTLV